MAERWVDYTNLPLFEQIRARVTKTLIDGIRLNMSTEESKKLLRRQGPNVRLKPKTNHITLKSATPRKICIKMETVFFFRSNPASNNPEAESINNTKK